MRPLHTTVRLLALAISACPRAARADHACEAEVQSACPDRPGADIAHCLKNPSEHEKETTISSECTDFIALNVACAESLSSHCEDAFFSADTLVCLTKWIDEASLPSKCRTVMNWAVEKQGDSPSDEYGMTAEDYAEKKAWQAKRKLEREAAIERMKGEKTDAKPDTASKKSKPKKKSKKPEKTPWLQYALGGLFVAFIFFNILNFFRKEEKDDDDDKED